jgi:Fe-S cluster biosynthesis and repair protein YggX/rhodanese-related sulfurtransferase
MDLKRVSAEEAKKLVEEEGYRLLDVRSMPEFSSGHPSGAINVPLLHRTPQGNIPNPDFTRIVQFVFPERDAKIITTCNMGARSLRAANELKNLGYQNVIDMRGGFNSERGDDGSVIHQGWQDAGLPVEEGEPEGRSYKWINNEANKAKKQDAEPAQAAPAQEHGHSHGDHGHDHSTHANTLHDPGANRFASSRRTVMCAKLGKELPGLKRRPYPGPLGERIYNEISADAWAAWVEHCKMILNEYRIHSADQNAMKMLMEQCETFLFGEGGIKHPEGYVPEKR